MKVVEKEVLEVVIWMNMPSHHQMAFFEALNSLKTVELIVNYYDQIPIAREKLGWKKMDSLPSYQNFVLNENVSKVLEAIEGWKNKIHIVPGFNHPFLKQLLKSLIREKVTWIHWSERTGKSFTKLLNYDYKIIRLTYPAFLFAKGYFDYARKINKYAIGAFAISELAQIDFRQWGVEEKKIKLLNYALEELEPTSGAKKDKIFIYIGALTKHKGIDVLIKAFNQLVRANEWKLILVGNDQSQGYYQKMVEKYKEQDRIRFTGSVPFNEINKFLSQSSVLILPTLFDGWGAVLNEAASLRKPLISTDQCGAAYHLIKDGKNGFKVKANSISGLREAMQFYIDNSDLIGDHGEVSFELLQEFTPLATAENFYKGIQEFLSVEYGN